MEEDDFRHIISLDRQRGNIPIPGITLVAVQRATLKIDAVACLLTDARGEIDFGAGKGRVPVRNPPVVDSIRPDDPARAADAFDFGFQSG